MKIDNNKHMNNTNYRHGDIAFIKEDIDIINLKKIGEKQFTVAEGEATGHHHVITATKGTVDIYEGKNGEMVISVNGTAVLTHPEHKELTFQTGIWKVDREQEYDYFSLSTRKVLD
ncbi:MAG: hypothetical protein ACP5N7_07005 [Candidatus Pacearchaeota archaeon]